MAMAVILGIVGVLETAFGLAILFGSVPGALGVVAGLTAGGFGLAHIGLAAVIHQFARRREIILTAPYKGGTARYRRDGTVHWQLKDNWRIRHEFPSHAVMAAMLEARAVVGSDAQDGD